MYDLFISYSTTDGIILAKAIAGLLEKKYLLDIFIADEATRTGKSIDLKVREAISQSKQLLALFTINAVESEWVSNEVNRALDEKKNIITCRRKDVSRQALPLRLTEKEHIVFTDQDDLLESLERLEWGIPLIIPAGGKSGGLYPLNIGMPKILLPVGKKPILHHIIDKLDSRVFSKVIILTRQFSEMVEYYASLVRTDIPIKCIKSPASKLPMALKEMSLETSFVLHYSDIIVEGDFDWGDFLKHHKYHRESYSVIGTLMGSNKYKLPVGRIKTGRQQLITEFTEKPETIEAVGYTINMAISIFEPEFLDSIEEDDESLYGHSLKRAKDNGKEFCLYNHERWRHIQTLTDWYEAQIDHFGSDEAYFLNEVTSQD